MKSAALFLVLATALVGCTGSASDEGATPTPAVTSTEFAEMPITVTLTFPSTGAGSLLGPAEGVVHDAAGTQVTTFAFESAWTMNEPDNWSAGAERSNAPTRIEIELPAAGTYRFELGDFLVSGSPCGTCEAGYDGGSVELEVTDGSEVLLPEGSNTFES